MTRFKTVPAHGQLVKVDKYRLKHFDRPL